MKGSQAGLAIYITGKRSGQESMPDSACALTPVGIARAGSGFDVAVRYSG